MDRQPASDAWEIAKSHPLIVNFDYDELLILSKTYYQQESTFEPADKMTELFFSPDFNAMDNAETNLEILRNRMKEVVGREYQLLEYYKQAAQTLTQN